jgi:hypothetical protein
LIDDTITNPAHPPCSPLLYFLYLIYLLYFLLLPHSFASTKISTLLFSGKSELFYKNTRGWGYLLPLYEDQNETANY